MTSYKKRDQYREDYNHMVNLYNRINDLYKESCAEYLFKSRSSEDKVILFKYFLSNISDIKFGKDVRLIEADEDSIPFVSRISFEDNENKILVEEDINAVKRIMIRIDNILIYDDGRYEIFNLNFTKGILPNNFWDWTDEHHVYFKMAFL